MEAVEPISPRALQLGAEYDLGAVRAEYRDGRIQWRILLLFLVIGPLFSYLAWEALFYYPYYGPQDALDWFQYLANKFQVIVSILPLLLIDIGILIGLVFLLLRLFYGEKYVYVCQKGYVVVQRRKVKAIYWENIKQITQRIFYSSPARNNRRSGTLHEPPKCHYVILLNHGKHERFSGPLGELVEREVTAYRLPGMIAAYQDGKKLVFGKISINAEGIYVSSNVPDKTRSTSEVVLRPLEYRLPSLKTTALSAERLLSWNDLEMPWIDETKSTLVISQKNGREHWAMLSLTNIPDVKLYLALITFVLYENVRTIT